MLTENLSFRGREVGDALFIKTIDTLNKRHQDERPREDDFTQLYQRDEIGRDKQMVEKMKERFAADLEHLKATERQKINERKQTSDAMEIVVTQAGELYNWFGANSYFTRTTEYDDIFNGVDAVVEFDNDLNDQNKKMALTVDVTSAVDKEILEKKLKNNKQALITGKSREVKYFQSEVTGEQEHLTGIIPVVVGLERKNCFELINALATIEKMSGNSRKSNSANSELSRLKEGLAKSPAQIIILKEIAWQLEKYLEWDIKNNLKDEIIRLSDIISEIMAEKRDIKEGALEDDLCYTTIKKLTKV